MARAPAEARLSDETRPADVAERGDLTGGEQQTGRDPAGLGARLTELDALAAAGEPGGGWRTVSAARAADELTGRGYDRDTAAAMVAGYLRDTADAWGCRWPMWAGGGSTRATSTRSRWVTGSRVRPWVRSPSRITSTRPAPTSWAAGTPTTTPPTDHTDHTDHTADDYPAAYDGAGEVDAAVRAARCAGPR